MERNNEGQEENLLLNSLCLVAIISQFAADSQLGVDRLLRTKAACRTATDCAEREREGAENAWPSIQLKHLNIN